MRAMLVAGLVVLLSLACQGPPGPIGATGVAGVTGPTGPAGLNGATGPTGPAGTNGTNGINGTNGATGPTGATGAVGATGAIGPTGPAGTFSGTFNGATTFTGAASFQNTLTVTGNAALNGGASLGSLLQAGPHPVVATFGAVSTSIVGLYCGSYTPGSQGNLGGYRNAKIGCEVTCGVGYAHLCNAYEAALSAQLGMLPVPGGIENHWIATGVASGTAVADCAGFTSGSSMDIGSAWALFPSLPPRPVLLACNSPARVMCCR